MPRAPEPIGYPAWRVRDYLAFAAIIVSASFLAILITVALARGGLSG
jgi:hypothetical protein